MTTVAEVLKRERETQGITLEEVAQKTYIKLHYLHALEEDRPDLLPAPVYTCGYIRQYAKLLGLNGAELVNIYQQQHKPREFAIVRNVAPALSSEPEAMPAAGRNASVESGRQSPIETGAAVDLPPAPAPEPAPAPMPPVKAAPSPTLSAAPSRPVPPPAPAPAPSRPAPPTFGPKAPADTTTLEVRIDTRDALLSHPEADKILTLARQQADEIIAQAREEANRLRTGAEQYAEQVLSQLETEIGRALAVIKNGRMHLQNRQRARRSADPQRLAERLEPPVS